MQDTIQKIIKFIFVSNILLQIICLLTFHVPLRNATTKAQSFLQSPQTKDFFHLHDFLPEDPT